MNFLDYSEEIHYPIYLQLCTQPATNELFRSTIDNFHSYVNFVSSPTRNLRWLIYQTDNNKLLGAIGLSSCVLAIKCRDDYIGWSKDSRLKNSNKVANNSRFCLIPNATDMKNVGSMALRLLRTDGATEWKRRYGDDLIGIETYIEPIADGDLYRSGTVYKADNWTYMGMTSGNSIRKAPLRLWKQEDSARGKLARQNPEAACEKYGYNKQGYVVKDSKPKMVFFKPLTKKWRNELLNYED